jgi:hypothetical protein
VKKMRLFDMADAYRYSVGVSFCKEQFFSPAAAGIVKEASVAKNSFSGVSNDHQGHRKGIRFCSGNCFAGSEQSGLRKQRHAGKNSFRGKQIRFRAEQKRKGT